MKKVSSIMLCAAVLLLAFTVGFFLIRNHGGSSVRISDLPHPTDTLPAETVICLIDLNTADVTALMRLPGIGEVCAQSIVDYRNEHGAFTSPTDLLNVQGIGQKRLDAIIDYITIGGSNEDTGC